MSRRGSLVGDPKVFPTLTGMWVGTATPAVDGNAGPIVSFSSTADLTDSARSHRLEKFQGGTQ